MCDRTITYRQFISIISDGRLQSVDDHHVASGGILIGTNNEGEGESLRLFVNADKLTTSHAYQIDRINSVLNPPRELFDRFPQSIWMSQWCVVHTANITGMLASRLNKHENRIIRMITGSHDLLYMRSTQKPFGDVIEDIMPGAELPQLGEPVGDCMVIVDKQDTPTDYNVITIRVYHD